MEAELAGYQEDDGLDGGQPAENPPKVPSQNSRGASICKTFPDGACYQCLIGNTRSMRPGRSSTCHGEASCQAHWDERRLARQHGRGRDIARLCALDGERVRVARDRQAIQRPGRPWSNVRRIVPKAVKALVLRIVRRHGLASQLARRLDPQQAARLEDAQQLSAESNPVEDVLEDVPGNDHIARIVVKVDLRIRAMRKARVRRPTWGLGLINADQGCTAGRARLTQQPAIAADVCHGRSWRECAHKIHRSRAHLADFPLVLHVFNSKTLVHLVRLNRQNLGAPLASSHVCLQFSSRKPRHPQNWQTRRSWFLPV